MKINKLFPFTIITNELQLLAALALAFLLIFPAHAIAIHAGAGGLVCGNCHTMHNSQGSTTGGDGNGSLGGMAGGAFTLLRGPVTNRGSIHKLCLQCHGVGGAMADTAFPPHGENAPKVYGGSTINWDDTKDFSQIGAGGDFFMELDSNFDLTAGGSVNALGYGHSMGLTDAMPPGFALETPLTNTFSCTICHDPHGAKKVTTGGADNFQIKHGTGINTFRNLKLYAVFFPPFYGIMSEARSWVGGITGEFGETGANYTPAEVNGVSIWPVFRDDSTVQANNNVYDGIGVEGMSGFCAQCHTYWHEAKALEWGVDNSAGEDWKRHPVDYVISNSHVSGASVTTIDWDHYDSMPAGFKLPAANTGNDLTQEYYYADSDNEDKVFCLSCHFAHGGPYYDNLRWDYTSAVGAGAQSGNSIASNKGCQICHNR